MKRFSLWNTLSCAAIVLAVAAICFPALGVGERQYNEARCQSNMKRLAEAMALYLADHDSRYPTNKLLGTAAVTHSVPLSPLSYGADGYPVRFHYGVNWVEGLQNYVIDSARRAGQDWLSVFQCPSAPTTKTYPVSSTTARVTYVFNMCMLQRGSSTVRSPDRLMMIREVDRSVNAICRPTNGPQCVGTPTVVPIGALLNTWDPSIVPGPLNTWLHMNGSYIVFADGHIQHFAEEYFPERSWYSAANCWDDETQQWWNYGPGATGKPAYLIKTIAITP